MAETGNPGVLAGEVDGASGVKSVDVLPGTSGPPGVLTLPSESNSRVIYSLGKYVTVAGMLAATNDAFYAVRGIRLPKNGKITVRAIAYDAGSEVNDEAAGSIPALGNDTYSNEDGEGFIHIHRGVQGIGNLEPIHDWRNPVVQITIERLNGHNN